MIQEIRRIIKESEIMKYVLLSTSSASLAATTIAMLIYFFREDDSNWPEKNKDGKQELEIRLGNEHISFEVSCPCGSYLPVSIALIMEDCVRLRKSDPLSMSQIQMTQRDYECSTI